MDTARSAAVSLHLVAQCDIAFMCHARGPCHINTQVGLESLQAARKPDHGMRETPRPKVAGAASKAHRRGTSSSIVGDQHPTPSVPRGLDDKRKQRSLVEVRLC